MDVELGKIVETPGSNVEIPPTILLVSMIQCTMIQLGTNDGKSSGTCMNIWAWGRDRTKSGYRTARRRGCATQRCRNRQCCA